jgi:hypothetical protein
LAGKQSSQQKMAMKIRLLNTCFSDLYYESFIAVNHRKTKNQLDRGDTGNSKHFYVEILDMANDSDNNDMAGESHFPDNEHLSEAMIEGIDLTLFVPATWTQAKKLLSAVFKEYDLAKAKFNKSGSHKKDLFGDRFTKDLAAYYFHLLLDSKPEAHKGVTTMLDDGVFYVAGGAPALNGGSKHPAAAALEKKKKKAARQTEANLQGAKDVMDPLMASFYMILSDREERREKVQESRDAYQGYVKMGKLIDSMVTDLSNAEPGSVVYNHLESRIKECEEDRQKLKVKSGRFE